MPNNSDSIQLLDALRAAMLEEGLPVDADGGSVATDPLLRFIEHRAFRLGVLVPIEVTASRAIRSLVDANQNSPDAKSTLLACWQSHVDARAQQFAEDPEEWGPEEVRPFLTRCAVVFGVEDGDAPELLRRFHRMHEAERFGIFVLLMGSPDFDYIKREIDDMPPEFDIDIEDPRDSMRALMRSMLEG